MMKTKREMILDAALTLFAEKGFDGVGVDEIAEAAGMKGPALYHYFKGKEALLDAILEVIAEYYNTKFGTADSIAHFSGDLDEFINMTLTRLEFTIHDPQIKKMRRMLAMEQFRNDRIRALTTRHHLKGIEDMNTVYLEKLIQNGQLKEYDPKLLAFEFTAPVSMMVQLIDREPEKEQEAMKRIRQHMEHFVQVYRKSDH